MLIRIMHTLDEQKVNFKADKYKHKIKIANIHPKKWKRLKINNIDLPDFYQFFQLIKNSLQKNITDKFSRTVKCLILLEDKQHINDIDGLLAFIKDFICSKSGGEMASE